MSREKKKMTPETMWLLAAVLLEFTVVGFLIQKVATLYDENRKYEAILELSCDNAYNPSYCRTGMDLLKGMSVEEIRHYNLKK